jgi:YegS/Rv2252/BmrU family lipid kinase
MPSMLVIYNPTAGHGRAKKYWPKLRQGLSDAGLEFDIAVTSAPMEATLLAERAASKYSSVIVVGGDGTIHEVVNGLLRASDEGETIALGVVPLGNGDDFAKVIPPETAIGDKVFGWNEAVDKIANGKTKLFDVGRMVGDKLLQDQDNNPQYFMNGMDIGFGAQATLNFNKLPSFISGMSAYLVAIMKTMIDYHIPSVSIKIDDQESIEQSTTMTAITNGRCFGSGFWVCPQAQVDDGLLDVMSTGSVGRLEILRLIPKIMKGTHINEPIISSHRARRVVIKSKQFFVVEADGEIPYPQTKKLEVQVLDKRLRVIV